MEKKLYEKQEIYDPATIAELSEHYAAILRLLGEDPTREGLLKTPERVAKAMAFMTKGYAEDPRDILLSAMFREEYRQMVLVRDIEVYSLCEHHMLPFYGKAHVAYIPDGYITGLSKVARVVECFARRLQVQERLTVQIRDCIHEALHPLGVAARRREAGVVDHHLGLHGHLPARPPHARGVHGADPVTPRRRSGRDASGSVGTILPQRNPPRKFLLSGRIHCTPARKPTPAIRQSGDALRPDQST